MVGTGIPWNHWIYPRLLRSSFRFTNPEINGRTKVRLERHGFRCTCTIRTSLSGHDSRTLRLTRRHVTSARRSTASGLQRRQTIVSRLWQNWGTKEQSFNSARNYWVGWLLSSFQTNRNPNVASTNILTFLQFGSGHNHHCKKVGVSKESGLDCAPNIALKTAVGSWPEIFLHTYNTCV